MRQEARLPVIGKGSFSTVYRKNKNTVLIKSIDKVKECQALGWFPNSRYFPKLKRVGFSELGYSAYYESKYYPRVKSLKAELNPVDYELYQELKKLHELNHTFHPKPWPEMFKMLPAKFKTACKALIYAYEALQNYSQNIGFEISPRNVAVFKGRLVLLDCFFLPDELKRS